MNRQCAQTVPHMLYWTCLLTQQHCAAHHKGGWVNNHVVRLVAGDKQKEACMTAQALPGLHVTASVRPCVKMLQLCTHPARVEVMLTLAGRLCHVSPGIFVRVKLQGNWALRVTWTFCKLSQMQSYLCASKCRSKHATSTARAVRRQCLHDCCKLKSTVVDFFCHGLHVDKGLTSLTRLTCIIAPNVPSATLSGAYDCLSLWTKELYIS